MSECIWKEIEAITKEHIQAFNTKRLDPAVYYTEDCQLIRHGWQTLRGHEGVEQLNGEDTQKLIVCDEIGPEDATDLAFSRGSFVLYTRKEEIITSGRYVTIWKKVGMKWLIHRDIPLTDTCKNFQKDEFQELVHAENKIVDAFNSEDFDPAQFYTEDFMLMPVGKEVVQGRKGIRAIYDDKRCNCALKQAIAVETITIVNNSSLAFCKGYFLLHSGGKVAKSGRYLNIWNKVYGQWFLHRSIPSVDIDRLAKPLEYDHEDIRRAGSKLLAAYNCGELEPSKSYTSDSLVIQPCCSATIGPNELKEVLKDNGGDNKSPKISVPHEIITNSDDSLAYEKGHFMYYSMEGEILIAGEYINIWKKVKGKWLIYRDISHLYYTKDHSEPAVFEDIRFAADKLTEACNSGEVNVTEFYTEDCILALPGHEPLRGKKSVEEVYKHIYGSGHHLVHVVEEIGPSTTTNLCYMKGHFIDCHIDGDVAHTGRLDCIMKKIDGKWLIIRDMPKLN